MARAASRRAHNALSGKLESSDRRVRGAPPERLTSGRRRLPVGDGAPRRRRIQWNAGVAERRLLGRRRGGRPAVGLRPVLTLCLSVCVTVHVFYSYCFA